MFARYYIDCCNLTVYVYCRTNFSVTFPDGDRKQGTKCAQFLETVSWQAKCFDLAKAYKQVPVSMSSRNLGVFVVNPPASGAPAYFVRRSLPFGACSRIIAFDCKSRSLWRLGVKMFLLNGGCFYDDVPMVEVYQSFGHSVLGAASFLAWTLDGFTQLILQRHLILLHGVTVDVSSMGTGELRLETKPSRFEWLKTMFENFSRLGVIARRDAQAVRGLLNFMLGAVMRRSLKVVCRAFSHLAAMTGNSKAKKLKSFVNGLKGLSCNFDLGFLYRWNNFFSLGVHGCCLWSWCGFMGKCLESW